MIADITETSSINAASKEIETILRSTLPTDDKVRLLAEKSMVSEEAAYALAFKVVEINLRSGRGTYV